MKNRSCKGYSDVANRDCQTLYFVIHTGSTYILLWGRRFKCLLNVLNPIRGLINTFLPFYRGSAVILYDTRKVFPVFYIESVAEHLCVRLKPSYFWLTCCSYHWEAFGFIDDYWVLIWQCDFERLLIYSTSLWLWNLRYLLVNQWRQLI